MSIFSKRFQEEALSQQKIMMSKALRLTGNEKDAEDLVQDTYIKAYRNFDRFEEGTNCRAWLTRIMTNEYISQYRHTARERASVDRSEEVDENHADAREPFYADDLYVEDSSEFGDEVTSALQNVPRDFRQVVVMADLQDRSYREISEKLSLPLGTVMSRLFRGRQILRQILHGYALSLGIVHA